MAYKFQLGAATMSGSLKQEGALECETSLTIGSAALTEAELEKLDGITNGTVAANKAVVVDGNKDANGFRNVDGTGDLTMGTITMSGFTVDADGDTALKSLAVDDSSTIGCDSDTDLLTLSDGLVVVAGELQATTLDIGGTNITATAAEINLIDGGTARGTTAIASGDGFLHNDAGTMRMTSIDKIADFFAGDSLAASSGVLNVDIDGLAALGGTGLHQTQDHFMFSDNGTEKKITFSNLQDAIFADVSGDATIAAGGALTIANDAVEQAMIADDAVGADQLAANAVVNASIASNAAIDIDKLDGGSCAESLAAAALAQGDLFYVGDADDSNTIKSATLSDVEDRIFANVSGDLAIAAGGAVTMTAAQTNITSIINSSIGKIGTDAAQEYIDFGTSNEIKFAVNNSLVASCEAGKFVVNGDLQVNGTTTSVNSTTINISSSFTFEGPADAHETVLSCGSPTADATLELFQGNAGTYYMPAFSDSNIKTTVIAATAAEINTVCDGGNSRGTDTLADGDGFIHNDNGTMKQTNVLKMFEYTVAKFSGDATVADTGVVTIAAAAVHHGMLNDDIISGQAELAHASIADADDMMIHDATDDVVKKVGVDSLRDHFFGVVSGDATIADGGALTIANDAVESGMLNDNVISGQTELASGDAVDADEMLISDGGTLKKIGLDSLKVYMSDIAAVIQNVADSGTLIVGVNYFSDMSADGEDSVTLPASPSVGQSVKVKAPSDCSAARYITINKAGSQTIDGAASIRLESPFAAVELVYVANDLWRVF